MARSEFKIRNPGDAMVQEWKFQQKLRKNLKAGEERVRNGLIEPFRGFSPEPFQNGYSFAIELTPDSAHRIIEDAVIPLKEIAEKNGIEAIYPGFGDIPPHVTLEYAQFQDLSQEQKDNLKKTLDKNKYFDMIARILSNLDFSFDQLVISGRDTYLCVSGFNSDMYPLYKGRQLIEKVFERTSKKGVDTPSLVLTEYKDIFHTTIMRITGLPNSSRDVVRFKREAEEKVGNKLNRDPIPVSALNVFHGSPYEYAVQRGAIIAKPN